MGERGVALLVALLALLILSAIAATLITMSGTETTVNANYRSEETAFFAARAGLYEVTDRMMQGNASSIASTIMSGTGGPPFRLGNPLGVEQRNCLPDQSDQNDGHCGYLGALPMPTRMTNDATKATPLPE